MEKIKFVLWFIWQLPQNLVALIMMPFMGKLTKLCYRNYCICHIARNMRGGISLGNFSYVGPTDALDLTTVAHEVDGHTKQSKLLGPLYLFVIGIPSISWAYLRDVKKHPNYYSFYTESWANKCANLGVRRHNNYYYTVFKTQA